MNKKTRFYKLITVMGISLLLLFGVVINTRAQTVELLLTISPAASETTDLKMRIFPAPSPTITKPNIPETITPPAEGKVPLFDIAINPAVSGKQKVPLMPIIVGLGIISALTGASLIYIYRKKRIK